MGNCCRKKKVIPTLDSSDADRVKNGGWKRNLAKRMKLAKFSARVDIIASEHNQSIAKTSTESDVMAESEPPKEKLSPVIRHTGELYDDDSILVLFYARPAFDEVTDVIRRNSCSEVTDIIEADTVNTNQQDDELDNYREAIENCQIVHESTGVNKEKRNEEVKTQGSLLSQNEDNTFFSSEESLHENVVDAECENEEEISEEATSVENQTNEESIKVCADQSHNDKLVSDNKVTDARSVEIRGETNQVLTKCDEPTIQNTRHVEKDDTNTDIPIKELRKRKRFKYCTTAKRDKIFKAYLAYLKTLVEERTESNQAIKDGEKDEANTCNIAIKLPSGKENDESRDIERNTSVTSSIKEPKQQICKNSNTNLIAVSPSQTTSESFHGNIETFQNDEIYKTNRVSVETPGELTDGSNKVSMKYKNHNTGSVATIDSTQETKDTTVSVKTPKTVKTNNIEAAKRNESHTIDISSVKASKSQKSETKRSKGRKKHHRTDTYSAEMPKLQTTEEMKRNDSPDDYTKSVKSLKTQDTEKINTLKGEEPPWPDSSPMKTPITQKYEKIEAAKRDKSSKAETSEANKVDDKSVKNPAAYAITNNDTTRGENRGEKDSTTASQTTENEGVIKNLDIIFANSQTQVETENVKVANLEENSKINNVSMKTSGIQASANIDNINIGGKSRVDTTPVKNHSQETANIEAEKVIMVEKSYSCPSETLIRQETEIVVEKESNEITNNSKTVETVEISKTDEYCMKNSKTHEYEAERSIRHPISPANRLISQETENIAASKTDKISQISTSVKIPPKPENLKATETVEIRKLKTFSVQSLDTLESNINMTKGSEISKPNNSSMKILSSQEIENIKTAESTEIRKTDTTKTQKTKCITSVKNYEINENDTRYVPQEKTKDTQSSSLTKHEVMQDAHILTTLENTMASRNTFITSIEPVKQKEIGHMNNSKTGEFNIADTCLVNSLAIQSSIFTNELNRNKLDSFSSKSDKRATTPLNGAGKVINHKSENLTSEKIFADKIKKGANCSDPVAGTSQIKNNECTSIAEKIFKQPVSKIFTNSEPSLNTDNPRTFKQFLLKSTKSDDTHLSTLNEEVKRKISLTSAKSLETLGSHVAKTDCLLDIFVHPADPGKEPKPIQVRVPSHMIRDGSAKTFIKTLEQNILTADVKKFGPLRLPKRTSKQHLKKCSSLVKSEEGKAKVHWTQKPGPASDVQLSRVPLYYEPSPRRKNMRERMGLEVLQKFKVQLQCKEIERIKVNADLFPGILPQKMQEKLNRKLEARKPIN